MDKADGREAYEVPYIHKQKERRTAKRRLQDVVRRISFGMIAKPVAAFLVSRALVYGNIAPFGPSFFACAFTGKIPLITTVFLVLGSCTATFSLRFIIKNLLSMALYAAVAMPLWERLEGRTLYKAALCGLCVFASGLLAHLGHAVFLYYLVTAALEALLSFAGVYVCEKAMPALTQPKSAKYYTDFDFLGLMAFVAILLLGISDISMLFGYSVVNIAAMVLLLLLTMRRSPASCCAAGVFLGAVCGLAGYHVTGCVTVLGLTGLAGALTARLGKGGPAVCLMLINAFLSFYQGENVIINLYECVAAIILFSCMPQRVYGFLQLFTPEGRSKNIAGKMQLQTAKKLKDYADSFQALSGMFEKSDTCTSPLAGRIAARVRTRVCARCGLKNYCWKKGYTYTEACIRKLTEVTEENGCAEPSDMPREFSAACIKSDAFLASFLCAFELERNDKIWQAKTDMVKSLMQRQFEGVSGLLSRLADSTQRTVTVDDSLCEAVRQSLKESKVKATEVFAGYDGAGRTEITVATEGCGGFYHCDRQILTAVQSAAGVRLERTGVRRCDRCRIKYTQAQKWSILPGCAELAADGTHNGDSHSFARLEGGKFLIALSDGMGTGPLAQRQSKTAVSLAANMLSAGFDAQTAVDMVNSILVTQNSGEEFATIDLAIADLHRGQCEFIKIGAAATFLRRKGGHVEVIRSATLPAGVLDCVETENISVKIEDDDMLIMLSDGVLDADTRRTKKEEWVKQAIGAYRGDDPQELADFLLDCAIRLSGRERHDDMTVLTGRIVLSSQ